MKLCNYCLIPMLDVIRVKGGKVEKFSRCPCCFHETRHKKINRNELNFEMEFQNDNHSYYKNSCDTYYKR